MSNPSTDNPSPDDIKQRKKRKEIRRKQRAEFQNRLAAIDCNDVSARNPLIIEIVTGHLKKNMKVFAARWTDQNLLTNQVFLNTPLFWYKKHKWTHKDVKEFFKIVGCKKDNLDSELSVIWGIDDNAKKKKKDRRKRLKEKHLRKESFASLLTLRHSSLRLMQERSMTFVQKNDPKAERASVKIWNFLTKSYGGNEQECPKLNHTQFNIGLNDNNIRVDPDMSVNIFYELITTWEIIEKHKEERKNNPNKGKLKNKYKQSRNKGGGILASTKVGGAGPVPISSGLFRTSVTGAPSAVGVGVGVGVADPVDKKDDDVAQSVKIKHIKKKKIDRQYIKRMLRHINKNIRPEHQMQNPKKLKKSKLYLVVIGKIFDAIQNQTMFDLQNDYLSQTLTVSQLNNPSELLELLETRDAEWKQRLQVLEYLVSNLEINDNLLPLYEVENFLLLIVGWTTQLYDERSRITQIAAELFPTLLTILLSKMDSPAVLFEAENALLSTMLEALFTLLKNKRAKTLSDIAHDVLIETINILSTVASDLDHNAFHILGEFLLQHTNPKIEKHEKVRAGCIAYTLFIIYGTQSTEQSPTHLTADNAAAPSTTLAYGSASDNDIATTTTTSTPVTNLIKSSSVDTDNGVTILAGVSPTPSPVVSDNENDEKDGTNKTEKMKRNVKIAKKAQRKFLFLDDIFMKLFAQIIAFGTMDKSKEARDKAMKSIKKIEIHHKDIVEKYIEKQYLDKYAKWKKFNTKGSKKKKKRQRIQLRKQKTVPAKKLNKNIKKSKSAMNVDKNNDKNNNGTLPPPVSNMT